MTLGSWIAVGFVALLIVGGLAWAWSVDNKYVRAARAFAAENDWSYLNGDKDFADRFPDLPSSNSRPRLNTQIIEGRSRGRQFVSYRYAWTKWRGKSTVTEDYLVTATRLDREFNRDAVARAVDQVTDLEQRVPNATWHVKGPWLYLEDRLTAHTAPGVYVELLGNIADSLDDSSRQ